MKKIILSQIITFISVIIGVFAGVFFRFYFSLPKYTDVLIAAAIIIPSNIVAYFIGRCPHCHMPMNFKKGSHLFEYCPYCGKRL